MKIFVSHAAADKRIVEHLVDLLEGALGVPTQDIFYTSQAGTIPNGSFFLQKILTELSDADLVISVLSGAFLQSDFCIAEIGAAMMRQVDLQRVAASQPFEPVNLGTRLAVIGLLVGAPAFPALLQTSPLKPQCFFPVLLPPTKSTELKGVLAGVQAGSLTNRATLAELRELIEKSRAETKVSGVRWASKVDTFIERSAGAITEMSIKQKLADHVLLDQAEPELREDLVHQRKIIFTFKNDTDMKIVAGPANWKGNVPLQKDFSPLRMKVGANNLWSEDRDTVEVLPGQLFRAWISLARSVEDEYLFEQSVMRRLGKLRLSLEGLGVAVEREFTF